MPPDNSVLAEQFASGGGAIFEHTNATLIIPGEPNTVVTDKGNLKGDVVVQASGEPFWRNEIFRGRMWLKMSYALAAELADPNECPDGRYITTDAPMRTIRSAQREGHPVLIFGGESHEFDEDTFDADSRCRALIEDVQARFKVTRVHCRWLAGDFMPYDRIPFIGPDPEHPSIYVVTGYRAWAGDAADRRGPNTRYLAFVGVVLADVLVGAHQVAKLESDPVDQQPHQQ